MSRTRDVTLPFGATTLAGTLHLPNGATPHPAIVMLQGSGPEDRDSWGYFPPIRDRFLDTGLAVLSWDKPGIGESTGDWHRQTFFDRADEAMTALAWLREQDEIDRSRTGIWGHSQGGWIAQIVAANDPDLAFAIINSGPAVNVIEQDLFGVEYTLRERGASEDDLRQAVEYMNRLHDAAGQAMPYEQLLEEVLAPSRGTPGYDYFGEFDTNLWTFLVSNLRDPYEPVSALERISCPVLAIFGERDTLVPVARSVRVFEEALSRAGNPDATIVVFPGADHRIGIGEPPAFTEGYLDTMALWLRERVE
ncbi:MAG TPA: alpha/beta fold hydrolase [Thermomicrobiales bacterium]|nr:alpha/beta fold hydrolase [Thermomicrobiales bacterium]